MRINKTALKNGLRIITVPMIGTKTATVLVMVKAGLYNETKKENGISHFLEHMAFKGTKKRPKAKDIAVELDSIGGRHNAFTGFERTGYWAKVNAEHIDTAISVISDISMNGVLERKEIEKERGVIMEEINMRKDNPMTHVEELFFELLYGDQPAGWDIAGPKENIKKFAKEDFVKYKKEHYVAENIVVAIAGNIESGIIEKKIANMFENVSNKPAKKRTAVIEDKNRARVLMENRDTTHFLLGGYSLKLSDERRLIVRVLLTILGRGMSSRLFTSIREKNGLAYYVRMGEETQTDSGVYYIRAGVDSNKAGKAIKLATQELKKIKDKKVSAKELKKAREMIKGSLAIELESSDDVAEWVAEQELLENKILTAEEYIAKIESVTEEQIQEVANELFTDDNLKLAMIGPRKDSAKFEKLLKI